MESKYTVRHVTIKHVLLDRDNKYEQVNTGSVFPSLSFADVCVCVCVHVSREVVNHTTHPPPVLLVSRVSDEPA